MVSAKILVVAAFSVLSTLASARSVVQPRHSKSYCPGHSASRGRQRDIFFDFVDTFFKQKNVTEAYNTFIDVNLIEHNPNILDGRQAGITFLTPIIALVNFELVHVLFDRGIGAVHAKVTGPIPSGAAFLATADFFRFDGTCIVEHWDVSEDAPKNSLNPHPLF
jgi:predicted SnoaL-like aldol condensation-catalyzing enzyme